MNATGPEGFRACNSAERYGERQMCSGKGRNSFRKTYKPRARFDVEAIDLENARDFGALQLTKESLSPVASSFIGSSAGIRSFKGKPSGSKNP